MELNFPPVPTMHCVGCLLIHEHCMQLNVQLSPNQNEKTWMSYQWMHEHGLMHKTIEKGDLGEHALYRITKKGEVYRARLIAHYDRRIA